MKKLRRNSRSIRATFLILSIFIFGFVLLILPAQSPISTSEADGVAHICKYPGAWGQSGPGGGYNYWEDYDYNSSEIWDNSNIQYTVIYGPFTSSDNYPIYNLGPPNPMNLPSDESTNIPTNNDSLAYIISVDIVVIMKVDEPAFNWAGIGRTFRIDWFIDETPSLAVELPTTSEWQNAENYTSSGNMNVNDVTGLTPDDWCEITIATGIAGNFTAANMNKYQIYLRFYSPNVPTSTTYGIWIDYLGLYYTWSHGTTGGWNPPDYPVGGTMGKVTFSLVWLIIIFLPAIVINEIMPKVGFVAGILLMLLFLGFTETGFLQVTVIGIVAVAVVLFKGGGDESD